MGTAGTFTVTATGFPAPTLARPAPLPSGVTLNATTGVLSRHPGSRDRRHLPDHHHRHQRHRPDATQSFTLTCDQAPAITSRNATTFTVGTAGTFTVTATGSPAPTFSETGIAAQRRDPQRGHRRAQPAPRRPGTGGTYPITFTATNGVSPNATQSFTLTVDQAPAITSAIAPPSRSARAGTFTVTATGSPAPTLQRDGRRCRAA